MTAPLFPHKVLPPLLPLHPIIPFYIFNLAEGVRNLKISFEILCMRYLTLTFRLSHFGV